MFRKRSENRNEWCRFGSADFPVWITVIENMQSPKFQITGRHWPVMFIVAYDTDWVILHHTVLPRQTVNAGYYSTFQQYHFCPALRWYRSPLFFMTVQGVTPLLLSWISCAAGNGRFWNIHCTHLIRAHCDYNLFAKVKEPLWRIRFNTRDELIHAKGMAAGDKSNECATPWI